MHLGRALPARSLGLLTAYLTVAVFGPATARAQPSVTLWGGLTHDSKPSFGAGPGESHNAATVGATVLLGSVGLGKIGIAGAYSSFSDGNHHVDVVAVVRPLSGFIYLDMDAGVSRASWERGSASSSEKRTSVGWLIGPVVGLSIDLTGTLALDLAAVVQFRWSPAYNDYLRSGLRAGLTIG